VIISDHLVFSRHHVTYPQSHDLFSHLQQVHLYALCLPLSGMTRPLRRHLRPFKAFHHQWSPCTHDGAPCSPGRMRGGALSDEHHSAQLWRFCDAGVIYKIVITYLLTLLTRESFPFSMVHNVSVKIELHSRRRCDIVHITVQAAMIGCAKTSAQSINQSVIIYSGLSSCCHR